MYAVGTVVVDQLLVSHYYFVFVADKSYALAEFMEEECTAVRYSYAATHILVLT